jgi:hypothetical protein
MISKKAKILLMWLLFFLSGNPIFYKQSWYNGLVVVVGIIIFLLYRPLLNKYLWKKYFKIALILGIMFIVQQISLGFVSIPFVFGLFIKIFIGAVIITLIGKDLPQVYFITLYWICILSFPFYIYHMFAGQGIAKIVESITNTNSIGLYTFRPQNAEMFLRNSSMFWEPGVLQSYINIGIFLNIYRIKNLWISNKIKCLVLLVALITTFSTTGYLVAFIILVWHLITISKISLSGKFIMLSFLLFSGIYMYNTLFFLGAKIEAQVQRNIDSDDLDIGRFGSMLVDIPYIIKHPFFGNGFHPITRYADSPDILERRLDGENVGLSNGLTGILGSMGFIPFLYLFFFLINSQQAAVRKFAYGLTSLMVILLFGEPLFSYSLFWGLLFINFKPFLTLK